MDFFTMSKIIKNLCIGHKPPDFVAPIDYLMLCPKSMGMPNELILSDDRFGYHIDGTSLAEYSQLFGLRDILNSGDMHADGLYLFQYRKFISPLFGGYESVAPWVRVITPEMAATLFPESTMINDIQTDLIVGALFNFNESISDNYSKAHVTEDLVTFSAACAESNNLTHEDIKMLASMRGIIPSPALCFISTKLFLEMMDTLHEICFTFMKHYHVKRTGYQSRSTGYLLERLHSLLICKKIMNGSLNETGVWNRYVINTEIN